MNADIFLYVLKSVLKGVGVAGWKSVLWERHRRLNYHPP